MRKYKSILVCGFLLFAILLVSCKSNDIKVSNNDEEIVEKPSDVFMERHVVELNLNNYLKYIERTGEGYSRFTEPAYSFKGCLNYAYYDDVVITTLCEGKEAKYLLNTAGNGDIPHSQMKVEIISITGKVIFWM